MRTVDVCSGFDPIVWNDRCCSESDSAYHVGVSDSLFRRRTHLYHHANSVRSRTQYLDELLCTFVRPTPYTYLGTTTDDYHTLPSTTSKNCVA